MNDHINIGSIEAKVVITGGAHHNVHSGNMEIRASLDGRVTQLRELLNRLVRLSGQHAVSPRVRAFVSEAEVEAARATLDISRISALMDAVRAEVRGADPLARTALDVINLIRKIAESEQREV